MNPGLSAIKMKSTGSNWNSPRKGLNAVYWMPFKIPSYPFVKLQSTNKVGRFFKMDPKTEMDPPR